MSMRPASCSACVPRIATAIARSHMRMRAQLPMFTTSDTAPIVQKFVRLATKPKMKARMNPPQATRAGRFDALPLKRFPRRRPYLTDSALAIARRIGKPRLRKSIAAEAARIPFAARAPAGIGVVVRDRHRIIEADALAKAPDLRLDT